MPSSWRAACCSQAKALDDDSAKAAGYEGQAYGRTGFCKGSSLSALTEGRQEDRVIVGRGQGEDAGKNRRFPSWQLGFPDPSSMMTFSPAPLGLASSICSYETPSRLLRLHRNSMLTWTSNVSSGRLPHRKFFPKKKHFFPVGKLSRVLSLTEYRTGFLGLPHPHALFV
jgi:hypothetical protein